MAAIQAAFFPSSVGLREALLRTLCRTETSPVFIRTDKRLHHFGGFVVALELVQFRQPEIKAGVIRILTAVWIAP